MRNHRFPSFLLLALLSSLAGCANDEASLGGSVPPGQEPDPAEPAPKCELPKSWSDPKEDGVVLATEAAGRTIEGVTADETHAYYVVRGNDDVGASELKRVGLDGGAPETLATLGGTRGGELVLRGDSVLLLEWATNGGTAVVSIPKAGGARSVLLDSIAVNAITMDANGDLYAGVTKYRGAQDDDVIVVRVNNDGSTTPAVRAPKEIAPAGVQSVAVAGKKIAWVPEQVTQLSKDGENTVLGEAAVYVTDVADPSSRLTMFGPYTRTRIGGVAMDEKNVYFGADNGTHVADVNTADSAKSFGPQSAAKAQRIRLDRDFVYWQTSTPPQGQVYEGSNAIGRAPKQGGAAEWLVERSLGGYDSPALAVGACTLVWRGHAPNGARAIYMRPKSVPGRDRPIPVVQATPAAPPSGSK